MNRSQGKGKQTSNLHAANKDIREVREEEKGGKEIKEQNSASILLYEKTQTFKKFDKPNKRK